MDHAESRMRRAIAAMALVAGTSPSTNAEDAFTPLTARLFLIMSHHRSCMWRGFSAAAA
jgi:hypothetical protein